MATCAQCLFENPEGSEVCEQCGAELLEVLSLQLGEVCRQCDSYNDPGVRVCISCGKHLGAHGAGDASEASPAKDPLSGDSHSDSAPPSESIPASISDSASDLGSDALAKAAGSDSTSAQQPEVGVGPAQAKASPEVTKPAGAATPPSTTPPSTAAFSVDLVDDGSLESLESLEPLEAEPSKPSADHGPSAPAQPTRQAPIAPPPEPPPGWAAVQRQRPRPAGGQVCESCQSDNPVTARFCGSCGLALKGAAKQSARARLIVVRGDDEGRQIPVNDTPITIGRNVGTLAFPSDPYLAPHHATFFFRDQELLIRDEGSSNGTYIRMRSDHLLSPGDMFVLGERVLRFAGLKTPSPVDPLRYGSPLATSPLMVVEEVLEGGQLGRVCKRPGPSMSIGRGSCDLNFPHDGFVSLRHAELLQSSQGVLLRDLESANGTYLRLAPSSEQVLSHGDYVVFGRELLRVEMSS